MLLNKIGNAIETMGMGPKNPPKPRYRKGDVIGQITVDYYTGFTNENPLTNKVMAKPQHWYMCRCSCTRIAELNQQELSDSRPSRIKACRPCRQELRKKERVLAEPRETKVTSFHQVEPETEEIET